MGIQNQKTDKTQTRRRSKKKPPSRRKNRPAKKTLSLTAKQVHGLHRAAEHAGRLEMPLNNFVTITTEGINSDDAERRFRFWQRLINRICQFFRDRSLKTAFIWTRESQRHGGENEHLHLLIHVHPTHSKSFKRLMEKWCLEKDGLNVDVRKANNLKRILANGKIGSVVDYMAKNSPQAAYHGDRLYRPGGPIRGKRCGCSQNLQVAYSDRRSLEASWTRSTGYNPKPWGADIGF